MPPYRHIPFCMAPPMRTMPSLGVKPLEGRRSEEFYTYLIPNLRIKIVNTRAMINVACKGLCAVSTLDICRT